jgi:hypothetical protein
MYHYYGELPTDLNLQDDTIGPPPAFFRSSGVFFYGLGNLEKNSITIPTMKPNPARIINRLKYNQEMPIAIPRVATRYTEIEPLSPMFRADIPKYGFGDLVTKNSVIGALAVFTVILLVYFLKFRA